MLGQIIDFMQVAINFIVDCKQETATRFTNFLVIKPLKVQSYCTNDFQWVLKKIM